MFQSVSKETFKATNSAKVNRYNAGSNTNKGVFGLLLFKAV